MRPVFTEERHNIVFGVFEFAKWFRLPTIDNDENPFENIFRRSVLNIIDTPVADRGAATFHPLIFRIVKKFLTGKKNKTPFDYAIMMHLQNHATISVETILSYIAEVSGKNKFNSREDLLRNFCECLRISKFTVEQAQIAERRKIERPFESSSFGRMI